MHVWYDRYCYLGIRVCSCTCVVASSHLRVQLVAGASLQWVCQIANNDVKRAWVLLQLHTRIIMYQLKLWGLKGSLVVFQVFLAEIAHHLQGISRQ